MRVSTDDVATAFRDLIGGARTREEIASWASRLRAADDGEGIEYAPESAEVLIWEALEFLMGVDMKDGPDSYLHNTDDFVTYWATRRDALTG